ncbi:MAG: dihydrolipoyl dehydrogenase [Fidelibacterota bacterium]
MEKDKNFDVVVIGGGPGGYVAAIHAAKAGKIVALVEKNALGGICLNWGCIPTKALLHDAEILHLVKSAGKYGIEIDNYTVDFRKIIRRSRSVAKRLSKGVEYLLKKNNITHLKGVAQFKTATEVEVTTEDDKSLLKTKNVIIATGGRNRELPGLETDGQRLISYREAMTLKKPPQKMIIIGAGAIGVEFATLYHEFGTEVHLVEMLPRILPLEDEEISTALDSSLRKRGISILVSSRVEKIDVLKTKVKVHLSTRQRKEVLEGDVALVAVGIRANIEDLGLESLGIKIENGWIAADKYQRTSIEGIYAIGDVIGPPLLAHVASAEGRIAAAHLCGSNPIPIDYQSIPACTYSRPQVASIGMTEAAAIEAGHELKIGRFPMRASGKAMAQDDTDGFVKMIFDTKYGELLGCHIIGPEATELIAEVATAKMLEATYEEIVTTIHAHPTIAEAIMEAAADAYGEAVHI